MSPERGRGSRILVAGALAGISCAALAADVGNLERGRTLYENHCTVCHTPKVHSRPNRIPVNVDELRQIITSWATQENLRWSREDVEDVVFYLNATKYRY